MTTQITALEASVYIATKRDRVLDQKTSQFVLISRRIDHQNGDRRQVDNLFGQFTTGSNTYLDAFYPIRTSYGSALYGCYPSGSGIWLTPSIDTQLQKADPHKCLVINPADVYLVRYQNKELPISHGWQDVVASAPSVTELEKYLQSLPNIQLVGIDCVAPTQRERPQDFLEGIIIVPSVIKTYQKNLRGTKP